ncbi:MAG: hypothetical protein NW207_08490 [Cytophagales bacterium]|nr:hypothetical protein [Cytophagales bacterium]
MLRIRLLQTIRLLADLGIVRAILSILFIVFLLYYSYNQCMIFMNSIYVSMVVFCVILIIHIGRNDKHFLKITYHNYKNILILEYLFISTPFLVGMLLTPHFYIFLIFLASIPIILFINVPVNHIITDNVLARGVPLQYYELKSCVRHSFYSFAGIYTAALAAVFFVPYLSLILLWLLTAVISQCYSECEPDAFIKGKFVSSSQFLVHKASTHVLFILAVILPICMAHVAAYPHTWVIIAAFMILITVNIVFFIFSKYAFYEPGTKLNFNSTLISIAQISIILPFLIPLPTIFIVKYWGKCIQRLNIYIND